MEVIIAHLATSDFQPMYEWNCPHCGIKSYGWRRYWTFRHVVHKCATCRAEYVVRRETYQESIERLYPASRELVLTLERMIYGDSGKNVQGVRESLRRVEAVLSTASEETEMPKVREQSDQGGDHWKCGSCRPLQGRRLDAEERTGEGFQRDQGDERPRSR